MVGIFWHLYLFHICKNAHPKNWNFLNKLRLSGHLRVDFNCKITQMHVTLINDFDKTFELAFYDYYLKVEL